MRKYLNRWLRRVRRRPKVRPMTNSEIQKQYPGLWVALKGGLVIAARQTPHALVLELEERGIKDATIKRAPADSEPELVGLG